MIAFGNRVRAAIAARTGLCVGIDPHASLLDAWGLPADAAGLREFGLRVVDAATDRVAFVKPQVAFFERFGSAGIAALEDVLAAGREAGLIVISDAKRGDIGSTMDGYAEAWLTPGSPLESDAITVSPYLGVGALRGAMQMAARHGKGLFVLAATSNPEAAELQSARMATGQTVAADVIAESLREADAAARAVRHVAEDAWSDVGFVVGATVDWTRRGLPTRLQPTAPLLVPGFGTQGAALTDIPALFGDHSVAVIASESRSVLGAGPTGITDAIDSRLGTLRKVQHG